MFYITQGRGFQIRFPNGYTVSVQFGPGNYCANRNIGYELTGAAVEMAKAAGERGSVDAETAVWRGEGRGLLPLVRDGVTWRVATVAEHERDYIDTVQGWQSPTDVLSLLQWAASQPAHTEN